MSPCHSKANHREEQSLTEATLHDPRTKTPPSPKTTDLKTRLRSKTKTKDPPTALTRSPAAGEGKSKIAKVFFTGGWGWDIFSPNPVYLSQSS
ncbi:expressed protein [Arabidopsis lyrata subsp. lyrata]|uniref:Expressed protein n=1 Tax=Arabidopsis lyrata subsp. lyrata TaxID=81972 RepID=D7MJJ4_ARALL|nr:expressed protein [Arabidopsis lyrata subsp. lyrata]